MGNTGSVISGAFDDIGKGFSVVSKQIETGVGAVGQSIGDLFYPDNPNRRKRIEQLQDDIKVMQNDFESLKKTMYDTLVALPQRRWPMLSNFVREDTLAGMQKKLDDLLKANNFSSVEEMDEFMQKTLNPDTLQEWNEFKKTYDSPSLT